MVVMSTVVITQWVVQHGLMGSRPVPRPKRLGCANPWNCQGPGTKGRCSPLFWVQVGR